MNRLYSLVAVPLVAGLLFVTGCSTDDEPLGPQGPTATSGPSNTPTIGVPTNTATAVPPTNTAPPTSTHTFTSTPTVAGPTDTPVATATNTPTQAPSFAGSYTSTLDIDGQPGLLQFTVDENGDASGTLTIGDGGAGGEGPQVIDVSGSVDGTGAFTLTGEGVNLTGQLNEEGTGTVSGTVNGIEVDGTVNPASTPTPTSEPTATETPEPTPTATRGENIVCGDGVTDPPETCDDGNTLAGDGCAANCTVESEEPVTLNLGTAETSQSSAIVQTLIFAIPLKLTGEVLITHGSVREDEVIGVDGPLFSPGDLPIAQIIEDNLERVNPIEVPGLVCACLRGVELKTCGGVVPVPGQTAGVICTDDSTCNGDTCQVAFGNGVSAGGKIGCNGVENQDYVFTADSDSGAITYEASGSAPFGAINNAYTAIGTIMGDCSFDESNPDKGPDGLPCTEDDPIGVRGTPQVQVQTSGTAEAVVINANGSGQNIDQDSTCGAAACQTTSEGNPKSCDQLLPGGGAPPNLSGFCLASAFAALDQPTTGDIAVPARFCGL